MLALSRKRFDEIRAARQKIREGEPVVMDPDWLDDLMDVLEELAIERMVVMSENQDLRRLLGRQSNQ